MFDLNQSRRNYNEYCEWWSRDESSSITADEYAHRRVATGSFWAKEVSPETNDDSVIAGSFMFDKSNVTIKSPDNLDGIKSEDLVSFRGAIWMVVNVQRHTARMQNSMFMNDSACSHFWYIELRK